MIGPSTRPDADVDYTFAQVSPDKPIVDWKGNCGNISSAVGPYSIDEGFVDASEPETTVRIHQVNTNRIIVARVPVEGGKAKVKGKYSIDGVPGIGAKIELDFRDFAGSTTGNLLPTENPMYTVSVEGVGDIEISIIDAANPVVFVRASDLGLESTETPNEIDADRALLNLIESIRGTAAEAIGLVENREQAADESPYIPFIALVDRPKPYISWTIGERIRREQIDLTSRLLFMGRMHKTYPITGTVATGVAAKIDGTIVNEVIDDESRGRGEIHIGHPAGVINIEVSVRKRGDQHTIEQATVCRTARRIMEGYVHVRRSIRTRESSNPIKC